MTFKLRSGVKGHEGYNISLICHFTKLGHPDVQNIPQYYTVEHSENMEGRLSNKMAALNGPNFGSLLFFRLDL